MTPSRARVVAVSRALSLALSAPFLLQVWAVTLRDPRDRLLSHFYDLQARYH